MASGEVMGAGQAASPHITNLDRLANGTSEQVNLHVLRCNHKLASFQLFASHAASDGIENCRSWQMHQVNTLEAEEFPLSAGDPNLSGLQSTTLPVVVENLGA
jgi:hypothetical protein